MQLTPPGSRCSIGFGTGLDIGTAPLVMATPGSQRGLHLVVDDIAAAHDELIARGVTVGDIKHLTRGGGQWKPGVHPSRASYMSFAEFSDPDGNLWLLQEVRRDRGAGGG